MQTAVRNFIRSYDFSKGVFLASAVFVAITFCIHFFDVATASGVALGVLITSISDIPGNKKHQIVGMLLAIFLGIIDFLAIQTSLQVRFLTIPVLAILVFLTSFISLYGFRASLVSFSGLLAIVLSFAHPHTGKELYINLLYLAIGGTWYLLLALVLNRYRSRSYLAQLINNCMKNTAAYLELRSKLYESPDREKIHLQLLKLETDIVTDHQTIRDNLLQQRGRSGYQDHKRKQLLILIELVQILELATADTIDATKYIHSTADFKNVVNNCEAVMDALSKIIRELSNGKYVQKNELQHLDALVKKSINALKEFREKNNGHNSGNLFFLSNLLDYTQKQHASLKSLIRYVQTPQALKKPRLKREDHDLFISAQDYSPQLLVENLSFSSPIFKHSLRLVIVVLLGYISGSVFSVQHAYWIILTIVVIMRPGYVLTKKRSTDRAIGTLIGGAIAVGIVLITHNTTVFAVLAFISLTLAFSFVQQNYKIAALFITLTLIFTYALITTDVNAIIQFRVIDTFIGVLLAALANYFLWPAWENQTIDQLILESVQDNQTYFKEVDHYYHRGKAINYTYKVARKKAFLSMANLHAGYQRMIQEPLSQKKHVGLLHEVVVSNHTLLSAIAAMGTYIQIHKTTRASLDYEEIIKAINNWLIECQKKITDRKKQTRAAIVYPKNSYKQLEKNYENLLNIDNKTTLYNQNESIAQGEKLKEARILIDHLNWIYQVSKNLHQALGNYENRSI